jgi:DNA-directed RNA polymerase subunit alpha
VGHIVSTGAEDDDIRRDDAFIETLDLTVRTYNCLKRGNIFTVRQLLSMRKKELLGVHNLGSHGYEEIQEQLIVHRFMHPTQLIGPFAEEEEDDEDDC